MPCPAEAIIWTQRRLRTRRVNSRQLRSESCRGFQTELTTVDQGFGGLTSENGSRGQFCVH